MMLEISHLTTNAERVVLFIDISKLTMIVKHENYMILQVDGHQIEAPVDEYGKILNAVRRFHVG